MKDIVAQRLSDVREVMSRERLAAFIIERADGTMVITMTSAALWTDTCCFVDSAEELEATGIQMIEWGTTQTLEGRAVTMPQSIAKWIGQQLRDTRCEWTEVGIDGMHSSVSTVRKFIVALRQEGGLTLRTNFSPLRPSGIGQHVTSRSHVCLQPLENIVETTASKLARIRQALHGSHADGMLMQRLDHIAWTLNMTPSYVCFLLISSTEAILYINNVKLMPEAVACLKANGVRVEDSENVKQGLKDYFEKTILMDPDEVCFTLYDTLKHYDPVTRTPVTIIEEPSPLLNIIGVR